MIIAVMFCVSPLW